MDDKLVWMSDVERWILTEPASIDTPADRDAVVERMRYSIPAVDAVEVVQCKDCVAHCCCYHEDRFMERGIEDGYCRTGRRREEVSHDV